MAAQTASTKTHTTREREKKERAPQQSRTQARKFERKHLRGEVLEDGGWGEGVALSVTREGGHVQVLHPLDPAPPQLDHVLLPLRARALLRRTCELQPHTGVRRALHQVIHLVQRDPAHLPRSAQHM
eukprot:3331827-Rhodomonas_salina.3